MSGYQRPPKAQAPVHRPTSALQQAQAPKKKEEGFWGTLATKGDKLTGAFNKGLSALYGPNHTAPGNLGAAGRFMKPLGGAFGAINGVRDLFSDDKKGSEKLKAGLEVYNGAKDLLETKPGQAVASKAKGVGSAIADSKVGKGAQSLWGSVKSSASGLGSKIMGSDLVQGAMNSKAGQTLGKWGKKAGGMLDSSAGWGAKKLNALADGAGGLATKFKGSKAFGALDNMSGKLAKRFGGEAVEQGAKGLAKVGGRELLEAGGKTAAKTGMKALGKAGARFVPGMNVALAGLDAKHAWDTLRDPNASMSDKFTSSITAVGSGLAATNIPIVSQIGAGVSTVSSLVEAAGGVGAVKDGAMWAGKKIGQGAQWAGKKIGQGAQWAGGKIKDGAQWAGNKISAGAAKAKEFGKNAWNGAKDLGGKAVNGAKNLGKAAWSGAKDLGSKAGGAIKSGAKSLWNGGKSLASSAGKKIGSVAGKVGGGIKKAFSGW
ncbi:MAG: hypothetical protein R3F61_14935 [Myxococcota bacterium]